MRVSDPMPSTTAATSAPTCSHIAATALTKLIFIARNPFAAYLIVSADAGSVMITGVSMFAYSSATFSAAARFAAPMTTRSGMRKSLTAVPSRRNSGFDTTETSSRCSTFSTAIVEPTGTVDLLTTTAPGLSTGAISRAACSMYDRSALPSSPCGVGTHRKTMSASVAAACEPSTNSIRPSVRASFTICSSPSSTIGMWPSLSMSTLRGSMSPHTT